MSGKHVKGRPIVAQRSPLKATPAPEPETHSTDRLICANCGGQLWESLGAHVHGSGLVACWTGDEASPVRLVERVRPERP
jgi:hypothetical protein